jgi:hypothetical protein
MPWWPECRLLLLDLPEREALVLAYWYVLELVRLDGALLATDQVLQETTEGLRWMDETY